MRRHIMMMNNSELGSFLAFLTIGTRFEKDMPSVLYVLNNCIREKYKIKVFIEDRCFEQWIESGTETFTSMLQTINSYFYKKQATQDWKITISFYGAYERISLYDFYLNFTGSTNDCYENTRILHKLFGKNMFDSLKDDFLKKSFIEDLSSFSLKEVYIDPSIDTSGIFVN